MGGKYEVRYFLDDWFEPNQTEYTSDFTNSFIKFMKIIFKQRKRLIYFTVRF